MGKSMFNRWIIYSIDLFLCTAAYFGAVYIRSKVDADHQIPNVLVWCFIYLIVNAVSFYFFKSYRGLIRHSNLQELWRVFLALFSSNVVFLGLIVAMQLDVPYRLFLVQNLMIYSLSLMLSMRLIVVFLYFYTMSYSGKKGKNTLVYGIGGHSLALAQWINKSPRNNHLVQGFLVRDGKSRSMRIHDLPVYDLESDNMDVFLRKNQILTILFPDYISARQEEAFISTCLEKGLEVMVSPPFEGVDSPGQMHVQMKPIQFEDLLGREEIRIDMERIESQVRNKVILITGAAGSIGSELVRQLAQFRPQSLVLFDLAETPLHNLRLELELIYPDLVFETVIGDVRSVNRLGFVFRKFRPQVVYHAAAYKHVPMMEENPCEAILVNVLGTKNLSSFSAQYGVERFVMISTDKAVNPTNVMGASKRMAEIYVQTLAKEAARMGNPIQFVTTRFGNVLGSNGSVIPHFKSQIERGGPVTVTHPDIIRYFMTIPEACRLVLEAASFGKSGEIYVFDMGEPVKIIDLARKMIELAGLLPDVDIKIQITGLRPGEKLYEELLNDKETTLPTEHEKITVAKVRQYDFDDVCNKLTKAIDCAYIVDIPCTIRAMKELIPEFKSQNSPFEIYDEVSEVG
ncbi:MAG TPA: nucleoside-diphosphate sugar epimerase/dehydratase [Bacteroidales bacterium]|nr:nucleoside-diphosphate sugar epimerase/dehydratase [Bacteroidales bacterium]